MAGIRVTVCLQTAARADLGVALAEAMAPFEMWSGFEWREIWDSLTIRGGSDGGGLSVLCGHENDPRLVHDWPRDDGELLPSVPGMCAGGPRGLLDSSTVRSAAG